MADSFTKGIAFIYEGETEKVFYTALLRYFCGKHPDYTLEKQVDGTSGEVYHILKNERNRIVVKMYVVGTISQITNSASWFSSRCHAAYKSLTWTAVLCYDTDDYLAPVSKFEAGDWDHLRKALRKNRAKEIIDMASRADIEDVMLLDIDSIFAFLDMTPVPIPSVSKGKMRLKKLFRLKGRGTAYHEGERAAPLINSLDFGIIMNKSPLPFAALERACFPED